MWRTWLPVAAGLAGALAGGWLAGGLFGVGLVLIVESGLGVTWGLLRDDGRGHRAEPQMPQGEHEITDVLDYVRRLS